MEFQLSYFKSWKMMLWKCCTQYASKFGNLSSNHRTGKGRFSFQFQRKDAKECSNYYTIALISHASKVMLKILQASLQQYVNRELPDVQAGFRKGRERNQRSNSQHPLDHGKSKRVPEKHLFLLYWLSKAFDCVDHNKLWKILQEMGIPDHQTCLLRNLYAGQEATVRTGHGTRDWFQMGKGVRQGCMLSPCLLNFYAEYIMRNTGLEKPQAGIKIARRNINNLRYADDTTLMAESEEELKSFLMKVRGEWKTWLKAQHSENEDDGIWSHHFMGNRWGNSETNIRLYFLGSPKSLQIVTAAMKLKDVCSLEGKLWPT